METANNDESELRVDYIKEQYKKMKAGARSSWARVSDYGAVDIGVGNNNKTNNNKNTNKNKTGKVAKTSDNSGEKEDRKDNKCTKSRHFHGKNPCRKKRECVNQCART